MKRIVALGIGVVAVVVLGYFALAAWGPTRTIGLGVPVRQDDFVYTVIAVTRAYELGPPGRTIESRCGPKPFQTTVAGCVFWVVRVNVENRAKRVPYIWDPGIVYLEDENNGYRQIPDPDGQRADDPQTKDDRVVPPGADRTFSVVFRLGGTQRRILLGYSNGILMGDVLDAAAYSRVRVLLEPYATRYPIPPGGLPLKRPQGFQTRDETSVLCVGSVVLWHHVGGGLLCVRPRFALFS